MLTAVVIFGIVYALIASGIIPNSLIAILGAMALLFLRIVPSEASPLSRFHLLLVSRFRMWKTRVREYDSLVRRTTETSHQHTLQPSRDAD
jgi:hypothetical protein